MGYPVYKLLRAINRQYPNNGFINYVDVNEETTNGIIDEDLRDLINEALQETYINIALDEVYSFPTVPGQKEYSLPEDCDLRDIQEVTRTFRGPCRPMPPPPGPAPLPTIFTVTFYANGGTGTMEPIEAQFGEEITLPACTFAAPTGHEFDGYEIDGETYAAGDTYVVNKDTTVTALWEAGMYTVTFSASPINFTFVTAGSSGGVITYQARGGSKISVSIPQLPTVRTNNSNNTVSGWEYNSELLADEQVLDTVVNGDMLFEAQYENVGAWNLIIDDIAEAQLEIKYKLLGGGELTNRIASDTSSYPIAKGDALGDRYEYIKVYCEWTDENMDVHQTLVYTADMTEVLTADETIPIIHYGVTLEVDASKGNMGTAGGNPIVTVTKYVVENCNVESGLFDSELNDVYPETGYAFKGWSLDGVNVIPNETILTTKVVATITYFGVFEEEGE